MGNAFIKESTLTDIANAIRTKTGGTDLLLPSQMVDAILSIGGGGGIETVSWADGTDEQIAAMVQAADEGKINLADYWHVGDERTVQLSAMTGNWNTQNSEVTRAKTTVIPRAPSGGNAVFESHIAQSATLVLMDSVCTGFTLATATSGGKTKPNFLIGLKNSLSEMGSMNSSATNANGWSGCARRTWCNDIFRSSISESLRGIFKQFKWKQGQGGGATSGLLETTDYFGLAPEKAIYGTRTYSQTDEAALYEQWEWYKTSMNDSEYIWLCSPDTSNSDAFCSVVPSSGVVRGYIATVACSIAPFGCI